MIALGWGKRYSAIGGGPHRDTRREGSVSGPTQGGAPGARGGAGPWLLPDLGTPRCGRVRAAQAGVRRADPLERSHGAFSFFPGRPGCHLVLRRGRTAGSRAGAPDRLKHTWRDRRWARGALAARESGVRGYRSARYRSEQHPWEAFAVV